MRVVAPACMALIVACGGGAQQATTPSAAATSVPSSATATTPRAAATSTVAPVATATVAPQPAQAPAAPATPPPAPPQPENTHVPPPPLPTEPPPPPPPPAGGTLTVVAINLAFDRTSLSAAPGPVTITFDNQDKAIAHNIRFIARAGGLTVGITETRPGPATDTLSLGTLAAGTYFYKCDVHPTTMTGLLTIA